MSSLISCLFALLASAQASGLPSVGGDFAVKAAKILTSADGAVINRGVLVVQGGRISAVGRVSEVRIPEGMEVLDLGDLWLVPGLQEPHTHIAGSLSDLNDMVYLANPELETHQVVEPRTPYLKDALAGGITTALLLPGSGTNMSGFGMLVKTAGDTVEEMVVRSPGTLKVAQAGNPERWAYGVGRALMNWNTRHTLAEGLKAARRGSGDPRFRHFALLASHTLPVAVHTQIFQVVMQTIVMQRVELGLDCFIDHGTFDGFKNGPLAAKHAVPVMNGPRQFWFDRSRARFFGCAAEWARNEGLLLGYNTDAPVIPQEELTFQAAMGVRYGHDDLAAAMEGLTINPARAMKCEKISGSLAPGLDADFAAWTGFPLDPRSSVEKVWVRGCKVYDTAEERRRF